jgi:hypothetical protein
MELGNEEGWYTDSFGDHEARWMSAGRPTNLVRDGDTESYDDVSNSVPSRIPERIEPPPSSITPADTLRADDAEATRTPSLRELEAEEASVAFTTEAHPWFLSRRIYQRKAKRRGQI